MPPPDTDPWAAAVVPVAKGDNATSATFVDAPVTRQTSGTDPGIGAAALGRDTVIDAEQPGPKTTSDDDGPTDEEPVPAADDELVAQLKRLGGRPQQHAHFQADSAGRYAASYAVVAKPAKSRATAGTDPYGVIVAPDPVPPAHVEPSVDVDPVVAIDARAEATTEPIAPPPAGGSEHVWRDAPAVRASAGLTTTPGAAAKRRERGRRFLFVVSAVVVGGLLALVGFWLLQDRGHGSPEQIPPAAPRSAAPRPSVASPVSEPAAAASTAAIPPQRPATPIPIATAPNPTSSVVRAAPSFVVPAATQRPAPPRPPTSAGSTRETPSMPAAPSPAPTPTTRTDLFPSQ